MRTTAPASQIDSCFSSARPFSLQLELSLCDYLFRLLRLLLSEAHNLSFDSVQRHSDIQLLPVLCSQYTWLSWLHYSGERENLTQTPRNCVGSKPLDLPTSSLGLRVTKPRVKDDG